MDLQRVEAGEIALHFAETAAECHQRVIDAGGAGMAHDDAAPVARGGLGLGLAQSVVIVRVESPAAATGRPRGRSEDHFAAIQSFRDQLSADRRLDPRELLELDDRPGIDRQAGVQPRPAELL